MKKIVLGIMAITLTISAMAQNGDVSAGKHKTDRKEAKHKRFKKDGNYDKLNLTAAQKEQVKSINEDFKKQMQDLHKQGSITIDEQKQKRRAVAKDHKEKIEAILTPEQKKQAELLSKDFKYKNGRGGDKLRDVTKDLNLTPDQSAKMSTLNTTFKNKLQEIRQNSSLPEDEKKAQVKNLMKQHRSDMEALLTSEQREQLKHQQKNKQNPEAVK